MKIRLGVDMAITEVHWCGSLKCEHPGDRRAGIYLKNLFLNDKNKARLMMMMMMMVVVVVMMMVVMVVVMMMVVMVLVVEVTIEK